MKLTESQHKVVVYLIEEGAKQKGRWVSTFPRNLARGGAVARLVDKDVIEYKTVPIPRSKWKVRRPTRVVAMDRLFYRINAAKLAPIKGVEPRISREIHRALLKGLHWTPWRRFHPGTEKWGAMRCGTMPRSRKCLKVATHVSYTVNWADGISGRVACCENCLPKPA